MPVSGDYYMYMLVAGVLSVVGMFVSSRLKAKFNKYSQVPLSNGWSGERVAQEMLSHFGISDVKIVQGKGFLTDHYNPVTKTVSLSPPVFSGRNISAAAVAAHECGHAVQHAKAYSMLQLRSAIVPAVKFASMAQQWLLVAAFMLINSMPQIMLVTIIAFAITTAFSLVTLPVEFDASKRALVWLDESGTTVGQEYDGAKDALWWAAMTYVAAALSALVMLAYLILRYQSRR